MVLGSWKSTCRRTAWATLPRHKRRWARSCEVSYILATEPGKTRYGTVKEIHRSAEVRGDEGSTVLIKVAINKEDLPQLRPGSTVTAKVYCGRRPLGYVLLHDVIAFIQTRILFKFSERNASMRLSVFVLASGCLVASVAVLHAAESIAVPCQISPDEEVLVPARGRRAPGTAGARGRQSKKRR